MEDGYLLGTSWRDGKTSDEYRGRKVINATMDDEAIHIKFDDGTKIKLFDDGQSCCESRYMTTDDDVKSLVGGRWVHAKVKEGPFEEGEYGDCHETAFLEIQTDTGFITVTNHNQHNGYYGGFGLIIAEEK